MNKFTYLLLLLFCMMGGVTKAYAEIGDPIQKDGWKISASSWCWDDQENGNGKDDRIIDGNIQTYWHSNWKGENGNGTGGSLPEWFVVDLGSIQEIGGVGYTPRQHANANGNCKSYKLFISTDNTFVGLTKESVNQLQNPLKEGVLNDNANNISEQYVKFDKQESARYILFVITESHGAQDNKFGNCGEFDVYKYVSQIVDITYNIFENNKKVASETHSVGVGASYPAVSLSIPSFFKNVNAAPTDTVSQAGSFDIKYTTNITGNSFATAPDVVFNVNGKYAKISGDETTLIGSSDGSNETVWKIVGDLAEGYKIYNVATGEAKTLALVETGNNKPATMSASNQNNLWIFGAGNAEGKSALHLKETNMYLGDHTNNNKLSTWENVNGASAVQSQWVIKVVKPVTYDYYIDSKKVATKVAYQSVGDTIVEPLSLNYATIKYSVQGNVTEETNAVRVDVTENLPFEKTTDLSQPKWHAVTLKGEEDAYMWYYVADNQNVALKVPAKKYVDVDVLNDEAYFWCFEGNVIDGFKIYNKKATTSKTLNTTTTFAQVSKSENPTLWKLRSFEHAGKTKTSFTADNVQYFNRQNNELRYWNRRDEGSAVRFVTLGSFAMNYAEQYLNAPHNAVGGYIDADKNLDKPLANVENNPYDLKNAKLLVEATKALKTNGITLTPGKYYRLLNKMHATHYANADMTGAENKQKAISSVVLFEATGTENQYRLKMQGLGLGHATKSTPITLTSETNNMGSYKAVDKGEALFALKDATSSTAQYSALHDAATQSHKLVGWEENAEASQWYIIPATDVEVALNTADGASYATTYLPFSVSNVEGATAYIGKKVDEKTLHATAIEGGIPVNTGVILKGAANAEKAVLTLGEATSDVQNNANALTGTLVEKDYADGELVFGVNNENKVGFYSMTAGKKIGANKAYLEAAARAMKLVFDGDVTGIENVMGEAADANAPIYDLTGRRVMKAVKGGLYIQNGKKFIAQ